MLLPVKRRRLVAVCMVSLCLLTLLLPSLYHVTLPPALRGALSFFHGSPHPSPLLPLSNLAPLQQYLQAHPVGSDYISANMTTPGENSSRLPSCAKLISGDEAEVRYAQAFMATRPKSDVSDEKLLGEIVDDGCGHFRRKWGFLEESSDEEKAFPVAYSVLMYRNAHQVARLLRAIYRPHNLYCLHVDAEHASPAMMAAIRALSRCLPGTALASRLHKVAWGNFAIVAAELQCMKDLWRHGRWRYFINLTGQEFPLHTQLQVVRVLQALRGANNVDAISGWRSERRWKTAGPPPHNISYFKGNTHALLSRGFVRFLLQDPRAQDFLLWLRKTNIPDEGLFSSLNHSPHLRVPGGYLGVADTDEVRKPYLARFKNWGRDGWGNGHFNWPCRGVRVRGVCVFGVGDLPLLTSRPELFANKFLPKVEPLALDCLEQWLLKLTLAEYRHRLAFNVSFYQQLPYLSNVYRDPETT